MKNKMIKGVLSFVFVVCLGTLMLPFSSVVVHAASNGGVYLGSTNLQPNNYYYYEGTTLKHGTEVPETDHYIYVDKNPDSGKIRLTMSNFTCDELKSDSSKKIDGKTTYSVLLCTCDVELNLIGTNTIDSTYKSGCVSCGIYATGSVEIYGKEESSLKVTFKNDSEENRSYSSYAIYSTSFTLRSGSVEVSSGYAVKGSVGLYSANIFLEGGTLIAKAGDTTGGDSIGIEGADNDTGDDVITGDNVVIKDCYVEAYGGAGDYADGIWTAGKLLIENANVIASSEKGSELNRGICSSGGIEIINSTVTATAKGGTGSAYGIFDHNEGGQTMSVTGSFVTVTGDSGGLHHTTDGKFTKDDTLLNEDNRTISCTGNVTLPNDYEIPAGAELQIAKDSELVIPDGTTLTNNGTITNDGTMINNGTIDDYGKIINNGHIACGKNHIIYIDVGGSFESNGSCNENCKVYFQIDASNLEIYEIQVSGDVKTKENGSKYALEAATVTLTHTEAFTLFINGVLYGEDTNSLQKSFSMPAKPVVLSHEMLNIDTSAAFTANAVATEGKKYDKFGDGATLLEVNASDAFTVQFNMNYITKDLKFVLSDNVPVGTKLLLINVTPNWNSQVFYAEIKASSDYNLSVSQFIKIGTTEETDKNIQGTNVFYQLIVILPQSRNAAISGMTVQVSLDGVASNAVTINAQKNSETVAVNGTSAMAGTASASIKVSQTNRKDNVVAVELIDSDGKPCDFPAGASIEMGDNAPVRVVGNVAFFSGVSDGDYTVTLNMKEDHMDGGASYQLKVSLCSDASDPSYPMANVVNVAKDDDVTVAPYVRHAISVESDSRYATGSTTFNVNYIGTVADSTKLSATKVQYREGTNDTFRDENNLAWSINIGEPTITEEGVKTSEVIISKLNDVLDGIYVITFTYGEATYLYAFVVTS